MRSLIIQDHSIDGNLVTANRQLINLVDRRFYLSFIFIATNDVEDVLDKKQLLQKRIVTYNWKKWSAWPTRWEEYLAMFFILKNEFIRYENRTHSMNLKEHTFQTMRSDWLPYRKTVFCKHLWEYHSIILHNQITCWRKASIDGPPEFDKETNIGEIYEWVECELVHVAWMENLLPPAFRTIANLREY